VTQRLFGFACRLAAAALMVAVASMTLVEAQGLPDLKDFLSRGYRIVAVVPDGARHAIYLQGELPAAGSLVICFAVKNERGIFNLQQGCDHLVSYDRKGLPGR
jgi:hypothetical protein